MLGHKSSLKPLVRILKGRGIRQLAQTVFSQGRTTRWGLAWSFVESLIVLNSGKSTTKYKYLHELLFTFNYLNVMQRGIN